jgi:hypothetical protein
MISMRYVLVGIILLVTMTGCGSFDTKFNFFGGNTQQITITTTTLPDATAGMPYSQSLTASGATAPYTWTLSSGTLPDGLSLNSSGLISGTPTAASITSTFTVKVSDSSTTPNTVTQALTIQVAGAGSILITSFTLPDAMVTTPYSGQLTATGGSGSYSWNLSSGSLPAGLTLNSATGLISGTTRSAGTSLFTVIVTDSANSAVTATLNYTLRSTVITIVTTSPLPVATGGAPFSQTFIATGGTTPYTWSILSGLIPKGLVLNQANGTLSGVPTVPGTYNLPVKVDTANDTTTNIFFLQINGSGSLLAITTTDLIPAPVVNTYFSRQLTATGGTTPYTWSLASGTSLPAGLVLNAGGMISGIPTTTGVSTVTLQVTDTATLPGTAKQTFTITVN